MILYKYLPPDRIDVIQNCIIRFTQYGDFNDPFELNPNIDKLAEENEIRKIVDRDFAKIIDEKYSKNPKISAFISKEAFIQLAKTQVEFVKNAVIGIERNIVKLLPGMFQKIANSLLGAVSLSEVCNDELMWSHYAEEHKGFVIGFDSEALFFNQKKTSDDELRHLRKIDYRDKPPVINLMNTNGAELFFVKSLKWQHEAEWRMLMPLSDSIRMIEKQPYPIHLFKFPPESVKKMVFGARISVENKRAVQSFMSDSKFAHVKIFQADLDNSSYKIPITPLI